MILKKKKKVFTFAVAAACVAAGVFLAGFVVHKVAVAVSRAPDTASKAAPRPAPRKATPAPVPARAETTASDEGPKAAAARTQADGGDKVPRHISLTVRAQVNTWIDVHVDGQAAFRGTFKKGVSSTWQGTKKIELSAKNLAALEFEVNGRNVAKLSRRDPKARKVIVTPEGLNVE